MRYKLPYNYPPIKCYLHHAYPLGIIWDENNPQIMEWFCANYNYIFSRDIHGDYFMNFFMDYTNVPFLYTQPVMKNDLLYLLENTSLEKIISDFICAGKYVMAIIDEYYLEGRWAYKKHHFMHEILIIGFDEEKRKFIVWAYLNDVYNEYEIDYSNIFIFPGDTFYANNNIVMTLYSAKQGNFELSKETFLGQIKDYLYGNNPYCRFAGLGDYLRYRNMLFGQKIYEKFIAEIRRVHEEEGYLNYILLRVIQEHFYSMYLKLKFILESKIFIIPDGDELYEFYEEAANKLDIMVMRGVMYNCVKSKNRKLLKLDKVVEKIDYYSKLEKELLNKLIEHG